MTAPPSLAPLERALLERHGGRAGGVLRLRFDHGEILDVPVDHFFRDEDAFDLLDRAAVATARGRVLDVGAAAGAHALVLQRRGHEVTALEVLPGAARVLRERGVSDVRLEALADHVPDEPYDTVLLLMNGTGLAGTRAGLAPLLRDAAHRLVAGGRVLVDSTDPGSDAPGDGRVAGEIQIQLEYRDERGDPFPHLYVDAATLGRAAREAGLAVEEVVDGPDGRFLAVLRWPGGGG